jgi:hypothetical protein
VVGDDGDGGGGVVHDRVGDGPDVHAEQGAADAAADDDE